MKLTNTLQVGNGLSLIAVRTEHAPAFLSVITDNKEHFAKFDFTSPEFTKLNEVIDVIRSLIEYRDDKLGVSYGAWQNQELIGLFTMNKIDWDLRVADVGYWLVESATGKGFAHAGFSTLIDYCFHVLELQSLTAHVAVTNQKSQALLEKAGFFRQSFSREKMKVRGRLVDEYLYQLTRD